MSKRVDESFHSLLTQLANKTKYEVNVSDLAKVIKYDKAKHTADVLPLVEDKDGADQVGVINECPVLYPCYAVDELRAEIIAKGEHAMKDIAPRVTMKPGATVLIVYNNRDLDNFEGGSYSKASSRMHDINDAVVVGVYE